MTKTMVSYLDNAGLPRAWAVGPTAKVDEVRAEAKRQLEAYKAGKPDPSCVAELEPFTEEVVELPAEEG